MPTVAIGNDHAGYPLKRHLLTTLAELGWEVNDLGNHDEEPVDYPEVCAQVGREVVAGRADRGIVIGGSGQGEQIAANKVRGVRAALVWDLDTAKLARQHNDANVISLGARKHSVDDAIAFVEAFIAEPFSGAERHQRRIDQLAAYEQR